MNRSAVIPVRKFLVAWLFAVAAAAPIDAQITETSSANGTTLSIAGVGLLERPIRGFFILTAADRMTAFSPGIFAKGQEYEVPATDSLQLYREVDPEDTAAEGLIRRNGAYYRSSLRTPLPESASAALLIFYLDENERPAVRALDISESKFPAGEITLFNLSSAEVACVFNKEVTQLEAGEIRRAPFKPDAKTVFSYQYGTQRRDGEIFKSLKKRLVLPRADMRMMIFFADQLDRYDTGGEEIKTRIVIKDARIYDRVDASSSSE